LTEFETGAVNTATGGYDYPNARWYGNTKQGKFMGEAVASMARFFTNRGAIPISARYSVPLGSSFL